MSNMIRLDKYLADMKIGTRSQVKSYIKKGLVKVDGDINTSPECKINTDESKIEFDGKLLNYSKYEYYMLNKPKGIVSATKDNCYETVVDYIGKSGTDIFPVGRLDIDTEGLLLLTNDGELAHELLSPKKHVNKTYFAKVEGVITKEDIITFKDGIFIEKNLVTKPAILEIIKADLISEVYVTICEGKFHQVKRMFEKIDKKVVYLKRISMGNLKLSEDLEVGEFRELDKNEIESIKNN